MFISSAIRSRTDAVGVGFLRNSCSSVASWSWVARCLFWFFCCCVNVLFRGGRREAELLVVAEAEGDGDGVAVFFGSVSPCSDMVSGLAGKRVVAGSWMQPAR